MDKQTIEEMAKVLEFCCNGENIENCNSDRSCDSCRAKYLYDAGYRKIPEDAVVLTREEYEKLQALKFDYVKGYEAGVDEGWDNAVMQTAEEFAERLIEEADKNRDNLGNRVVFICDIENVCKEITEGK